MPTYHIYRLRLFSPPRSFVCLRYLPCASYVPTAVSEASKRGYGFVVLPLLHPQFPVVDDNDNMQADPADKNHGDDDGEAIINDNDDSSAKASIPLKESSQYDQPMPRKTSPISPSSSSSASPSSSEIDSLGHPKPSSEAPLSVDFRSRLTTSRGAFINSFQDLSGGDWGILVVSDDLKFFSLTMDKCHIVS